MAITDVSRDLIAAMSDVRIERGETSVALAEPGSPTPADRVYLNSLHAKTVTKLKDVETKLAALAPGSDRYGQDELRRLRATFEGLRLEADAALGQPIDRRPAELAGLWMNSITRITDVLSDTSARLSSEVDQTNPSIGEMMVIGQLAWKTREAAGSQMLLLGRAVAIGKPVTQAQIDQFNTLTGRVDATWAILETRARLVGAPPGLTSAIETANRVYFGQDRSMLNLIVREMAAGGASSVTVSDLRQLNTQAQGTLIGVAGAAFNIAAQWSAHQAAQAETVFYVAVIVMGLTFGLGLASMLYVNRSVLRPIGDMTEAMLAVADGDLTREIPGVGRSDEVGNLARALGIFRANALAQQRMDEELVVSRVAKETAEAAARTKAQFLANMSHEIRTPLTSVIGFANLLARLEGLSDKASSYATRILTGGQALLSLVDNILDFSRIDAGRIELAPQPGSLAQVIGDTVELMQIAAEKKGLSLNLQLSPNLPTTVCIDPDRFRQILLNLIGNAIKFTDVGDVRIEADYRDAEAAQLHIRIKDTGIGVCPEQRDRLFQRFSQIDGSNTRSYGGAGLGLAISKGLVELMGGEIGVESQPGRGSTFWFTLTAPRVDQLDLGALCEGASEPQLGTVRILIVDDVEANRQLVSAMLSGIDVCLGEATNGAEAIEAAARERFDLILMDLQMPVMDGWAAARAIRLGSPLNADTPILAVSANVMPSHVKDCQAAGMNDHISKPISHVELLTKVGQWTESA